MTAAVGTELGVEQSRRARPGPLIAHVVTTFIGAGFFLGSFRYDLYRAEEQIGPAFLPRYASVLLVVLGLLLVPLLGLILSLMLLVSVLTIGVERMPAVPSLLITAAAGAVAYLVFIVTLRVPLPMGVLEGIL